MSEPVPPAGQELPDTVAVPCFGHAPGKRPTPATPPAEANRRGSRPRAAVRVRVCVRVRER